MGTKDEAAGTWNLNLEPRTWHVLRLVWTVILGVWFWCCPGDNTNAQPPRIDRANLLLYRRSGGEIRPVTSVGDWRRRRAEILRGMQQVMGPLPGKTKRCPLDVTVEEEMDCGAYVRRFLTYNSEPGSRVPAYLLIPKATLERGRKTAGILCLHQTHSLGQKVVVGLGNSTNDAYGVELVKRGYICLAPAYPLLANYHPDLKALGYQSGTMKAIWDNVRGLDLLESLPFVRRARFGAIGHSLGGHNAIFTAVFDERIQVIVSSCGFDSFLDYMNGNIQGWTSDRYMPRLLAYRDRLDEIPFDFHELLGALAPRRLFISAPLGDTNFDWRSVDAVAKAASQVYALYGAPQRLRVEHPDCGHLFPPRAREAAYQWFDENLK
ncbi:MAG: alpha/beta hydrolase [Verrucomicrobia bacterium]|nr:MAG: alpha/beta hydrolase [Verrucomicrobiota bacterium]